MTEQELKLAQVRFDGGRAAALGVCRGSGIYAALVTLQGMLGSESTSRVYLEGYARGIADYVIGRGAHD